jgi:hypothetical protein
MLARLLKLLHELGSFGTLGSVTACLILLRVHSGGTAHDPAAAGDVVAVIHYLLMPSFAAVLLSGLLAIAATPAYINAGWAWIKALLGISVFEASLELSATSREVEQLSRQLAAGHDVLSRLTVAGRTERGVLWVLLGVSIANVVLGIWRLRFVRNVRRQG